MALLDVPLPQLIKRSWGKARIAGSFLQVLALQFLLPAGYIRAHAKGGHGGLSYPVSSRLGMSLPLSRPPFPFRANFGVPQSSHRWLPSAACCL